jgi:hypothetical protein
MSDRHAILDLLAPERQRRFYRVLRSRSYGRLIVSTHPSSLADPAGQTRGMLDDLDYRIYRQECSMHAANAGSSDNDMHTVLEHMVALRTTLRSQLQAFTAVAF